MSATALASANIGDRLSAMAEQMPEDAAVIVQARRRHRQPAYCSHTFAELDSDSDLLARGLQALGVTPGTRLVLLVRPGYEFVALAFALFKARAVAILIDPGVGRRSLFRCLEGVRPQGFVAIPLVQAIRRLMPRRFAAARFNITVGRPRFPGTMNLDRLRALGRQRAASSRLATLPDEPAAIIFTTGSTGPPKPVEYRHQNISAQVDQIREQYGTQRGEVDLACFPLFALFNGALGVTTVIPAMDSSRSARADPARLVAAINDCRVTQSFASPAVWKRVGSYCEARRIRLPTLQRVFAAGAPVSPDVLRRMKACLEPTGEVHTPYGATEALPIATIEAEEVLGETAERWRRGAGTCVGRPFPGIQWRVIPLVDGAIAGLDALADLAAGQIGELVVRGPQVTHQYCDQPAADALAKVDTPQGRWHRTGDAGYLDPLGRFWYCGRAAERVVTSRGTLFTDPCEGVFNAHPEVERAALVGVGPRGAARPVLVVEPVAGWWPRGRRARRRLAAELLGWAGEHSCCTEIVDVLFRRRLPVDRRHNAKILRPRLADWAARQLRGKRQASA